MLILLKYIYSWIYLDYIPPFLSYYTPPWRALDQERSAPIKGCIKQDHVLNVYARERVLSSSKMAVFKGLL